MTDLAKKIGSERYRRMVEMRHFDEACMEGAESGEIHGELHLAIGQEAIAASMAEVLLPDDALVSHHRNHYHALAKGVDKRQLLAEIFEKKTGLCRGRGGHMHPFDMQNHFSASGIVGASWPVALGYAYKFWMDGSGSVAVAVAGDGASNQGTFHEVANMASVWRLPLLMIVENNGFGISVPTDSVVATPNISDRAKAYDMWGRTVDGTDIDETADAFAAAMKHVRDGNGPALLEATCHRFRGHFEGDLDFYRSKSDMDRHRETQDPITKYTAKLVSEGIADALALDEIRTESLSSTHRLLDEVRRDPSPDPANALKYIFGGE